MLTDNAPDDFFEKDSLAAKPKPKRKSNDYPRYSQDLAFAIIVTLFGLLTAFRADVILIRAVGLRDYHEQYAGILFIGPVLGLFILFFGLLASGWIPKEKIIIGAIPFVCAGCMLPYLAPALLYPRISIDLVTSTLPPVLFLVGFALTLSVWVWTREHAVQLPIALDQLYIAVASMMFLAVVYVSLIILCHCDIEDSAVLNDRQYYLYETFWWTDSVPAEPGYELNLYECNQWGLFCSVIHQSSWDYPPRAHLNTDSANSIAIIDGVYGEIIHTYYPEE